LPKKESSIGNGKISSECNEFQSQNKNSKKELEKNNTLLQHLVGVVGGMVIGMVVISEVVWSSAWSLAAWLLVVWSLLVWLSVVVSMVVGVVIGVVISMVVGVVVSMVVMVAVAYLELGMVVGGSDSSGGNGQPGQWCGGWCCCHC
jgi:hypothetical protein